MERPFTKKCKDCGHWAGCDWYPLVEELEDAAINHSGETAWLWLTTAFAFKCGDFKEETE